MRVFLTHHMLSTKFNSTDTCLSSFRIAETPARVSEYQSSDMEHRESVPDHRALSYSADAAILCKGKEDKKGDKRWYLVA